MQKAQFSVAERKIQKMELALFRQKTKLAQLRRKIKPRLVADETLTTSQGKKIKLSKLFGKSNELILIHNMGKQCSYCTLWADGFNGVAHHLENRAGFAVESPNSPLEMKKFAASRGWKFTFVSSQGTGFRSKMGFMDSEGKPQPGVSTFIKDSKGKIYQTARTYFGPGDSYCSTWDLLDLLPQGANGWGPKFFYKR